MKRTLLDISGKLDAATIGIFELIRDVAAAKNIKFFTIGAMARDLIFHHGYGIEVGRATRDIDLAVQVSDWDQFAQLKNGLLETGSFNETNKVHKLVNDHGMQFDIVPFGTIKQQDGSISWLPDNAVKMNVLGFDEALEDAMPMKLNMNPHLEVLVVSPTSLVVLKLISWKDRPQERARDAIDIGFVINHYLDAGNNERFFEDHSDIMASPFDYIESGARLLGRDIANLAKQETLSTIIDLLEQQTAENSQHLLIQHMIARADEDSQFDIALRNLMAIRDGIRDITG